jgi:pimeloyl-ACP methyl ester carboxylesterase
MSAVETTLTAGTLKLQAQCFGDESQPLLLALHGWLDNSASMAPLADELSHEYYVVVPDLPGHGFSDQLPAGFVYSFENQVAILFQLVNETGWKNFSVLGHSLGCGLGTALAAACPEKVTQLIMLDKLGPPVLAEQNYLQQFLLNMQCGKQKPLQAQAIYKSADEAINIRCLISACSQTTARLIVSRDLQSVPGGYVSRLDRRLHFKSHRALTQTQSHILLQAIKCPSLYIKAQAGQALEDDTTALEMLISQLTVVTLPGNHHFHVDDPAAVAQHMRDFALVSQVVT